MRARRKEFHYRTPLRTRLTKHGDGWAEPPDWVWALEQILLAPDGSRTVN